MNDRVRAFWQRHASFLTAVLLHIVLIWLALPFLVNRTEPLPSDPLDVSIVRLPKPPPKPKPKPVFTKPAVRPAEVNSTASRANLRSAPRLPHLVQPEMRLPLPAPVPAKAPMVLPVASGPPTPGGPPSGSGGKGAGAGNGTGNGTQEGNDYLIRLRAYIDAHKNGERHREPNDADVVLVLDPDGVLHDIHIAASTGDPAVDYEIMLQLRQMSPFPKPPPILFSPSQQLLPVADKWTFPRP
jgi:outer membrane biosynthesis protein TonB